MHDSLTNKDKTISVIGLGYVGLPLALAFAGRFRVIGFDINADRVEMMKQGVDPSEELDGSAFEGKDIHFTADPEKLKEAHFHVVAVPTPVDEHKVPNLRPVLSASETVGRILKPGDYVIFESTVYPGCTEEDCLPILERLSGLKAGRDFKLGYSPERINPGDKERTIEKILKIVSGNDTEALEEIAKVYGDIIHAGIYRAPSIKVAEAAKVIENAQRDLNISFVNELAIIFDRLDIDTNAGSGGHQVELPEIQPRPGRRPLYRRRPLLPDPQGQTAGLRPAGHSQRAPHQRRHAGLHCQAPRTNAHPEG